MGTTEFVVAGMLPEIAGNLQVSVAQTGPLIMVFAVGTPLTAMLTLRLPASIVDPDARPGGLRLGHVTALTLIPTIALALRRQP